MAQRIWSDFDPEVKVKPELVFMDPEEKGITAVSELTIETVKVKVNAPYRVCYEGKPYSGGDVLTVPKDDERDTWIKAGWATPVQKGKA